MLLQCCPCSGLPGPGSRLPTDLLWNEAVGQTPTALTQAVLRVGSKIVRLVARTQRDRADVGAPSVRYGQHSAHSAGFRGRLCATASNESGIDSPVGGTTAFARDSARLNESRSHARKGRSSIAPADRGHTTAYAVRCSSEANDAHRDDLEQPTSPSLVINCSLPRLPAISRSSRAFSSTLRRLRASSHAQGGPKGGSMGEHFTQRPRRVFGHGRM